MEKDEVVVVVACMDRRLVEILKLLDDNTLEKEEKKQRLRDLFNPTMDPDYLALQRLVEELHGKNVVVLANAGTNLKGLEGTINDLKGSNNLTQMVVVTHTQCRGMDVVRSCLEDSNKFGSLEYVHLGVDEYSAGKNVEKQNQTIQERRANNIISKVESVNVDVALLNLPSTEGNHTLIVAKPSIGNYRGNFAGMRRFEVYGIVGNVQDIEVDRKIAGAMGIREILKKEKI